MWFAISPFTTLVLQLLLLGCGGGDKCLYFLFALLSGNTYIFYIVCFDDFRRKDLRQGLGFVSIFWDNLCEKQ